MAADIDHAIRRDIGGDVQQIHSQNTRYQNSTYKLIMLPVWYSAIEYKGKMYLMVINGQSGKVAGHCGSCRIDYASYCRVFYLSIARLLICYTIEKESAMKIIELPKTDINKIKSLWESLNRTHLENSNNWKNHFSEQTFEKRFEKLLKEEHVYILVAINKNEIVAYSFATIKKSIGEIDSIFVKNEYRKKEIGKKLISQAIEWMKKQNVSQIVVSVAEGNENVFPFYERLGFKKNMTILKLV